MASLPDRSALEVAAAGVAAERLVPSPALVAAWRELHHAAQIASEVGKSWAVARADDSHSTFAFRDGELVGAPVAGPDGLRATLRVRDLVLRLVAPDGTTRAELALGGATCADGMRWIRAETERLAGPPRQRATPAPDLPPHPVAQGAPFAPAAELDALARLLGGADAFLRTTGAPVRIWPHHFDMAVLLERAPGRTIGVGLAVPDAMAPAGYWYVSPWAAEPRGPREWPALAHGRWVARGDALAIAVLPLDAWSALPDAEQRRSALAGFLAAALDASARALGA